MKRIGLIFALVALAAGCHGQQPPSPPAYVCPAAPAAGGVYTELNAPASNTVAASITGSTYKEAPGTGTWCYIVQTWALPVGGTIYQASLPSNVQQATTTAALPAVDLSWTPPSANSSYGPYTYIVSRAAAALVAVPTAPALSGTTSTSSVVKPALPQVSAPATLALGPAAHLTRAATR
jgi:hypothetical protein